jgi:hypothetical protein
MITWAMRRMTGPAVVAAIPATATGPRPCSPSWAGETLGAAGPAVPAASRKSSASGSRPYREGPVVAGGGPGPQCVADEIAWSTESWLGGQYLPVLPVPQLGQRGAPGVAHRDAASGRGGHSAGANSRGHSAGANSQSRRPALPAACRRSSDEARRPGSSGSTVSGGCLGDDRSCRCECAFLGA